MSGPEQLRIDPAVAKFIERLTDRCLDTGFVDRLTSHAFRINSAGHKKELARQQESMTQFLIECAFPDEERQRQ